MSEEIAIQLKTVMQERLLPLCRRGGWAPGGWGIKMYQRNIEFLRERLEQYGHLTGVAAGSGMTAKYAAMGGCDLILALSSGKYRSMGLSSMAGFLCYSNSNDLVMEYAKKEILRAAGRVPVIFGLNATDPTRSVYEYIREIKEAGFSGVNNYPTVGMIDGNFRIALEESHINFQQEVEAVHFAHYCELLTVAFVFDSEQAREMARAGADIICAHFGLTSGGYLGAQKVLSLEKARCTAKEIFEAARGINSEALCMVYGGPVKTPADAQFMYVGSGCQGFIGGSAFERIPIEKAVLKVTRDFRENQPLTPSSKLENILYSNPGNYPYVEFIKEYVNESYMTEVRLSELAQVVHCSVSYLSSVFKRETGCSFREYLIGVRMENAREMIKGNSYPLVQVARNVGYEDYAQFSKMYKKYMGKSPREDSQNQKKTQKNIEIGR